MIVLAAVVITLAFASIEAKIVFGFFLLCAAPFVVLVWWRVGQRLVLHEDRIEWVQRLGAPKVISWTELSLAAPENRHLYLPTPNWNGNEVAMPSEILDREPSRPHAPTDLGFDLARDLIAIRASEPNGDWHDQLAIVFRARLLAKKIGPNTRVPVARVARR